MQKQWPNYGVIGNAAKLSEYVHGDFAVIGCIAFLGSDSYITIFVDYAYNILKPPSKYFQISLFCRLLSPRTCRMSNTQNKMLTMLKIRNVRNQFIHLFYFSFYGTI